MCILNQVSWNNLGCPFCILAALLCPLSTYGCVLCPGTAVSSQQAVLANTCIQGSQGDHANCHLVPVW